jgi:4'-phosphopantetheinyl transferase
MSEIRIYSTTLPKEDQHSLINLFCERFPIWESHCKAYHQVEDALRFITARALLAWGLNKYGITSTMISQIQNQVNGRPFLPEVSYDFNISHSGDKVVLALNEGGCVGIDIEAVREIQFEDFRDYFTPNEFLAVQNAEDSFKKFYQIWTRKEALYKSMVEGYLEDFKEIDTLNSNHSINDKEREICDLVLDEAYLCAIAYQPPASIGLIEEIDFRGLMRSVLDYPS